jgi:hypothetical protein
MALGGAAGRKVQHCNRTARSSEQAASRNRSHISSRARAGLPTPGGADFYLIYVKDRQSHCIKVLWQNVAPRAVAASEVAVSLLPTRRISCYQASFTKGDQP